jgi:hypothetical protein
MSVDERMGLRKEKSKMIFEEFYSWISEIESKTLPQSLVGKAITYAINQKEYLGSFLLDGRIQLSNNLCEQMVKPFVIGRRNWLFLNTPNGATSSTIIYSIIQTAILNDLKPAKYLEYLFTRVQAGDNIQIYTPWSNQLPEYCKNVHLN